MLQVLVAVALPTVTRTEVGFPSLILSSIINDVRLILRPRSFKE